MPPPLWPPVEIEQALQAAARKHGLPVSLLRAVAYVESAFNPRAISDRGALGLMQLMPDTARMYDVDDPMNVQQSANGGAAFLAKLLHAQRGDTLYALQAYNWGPMRLAQAQAAGNQAPVSVKAYAIKVVGLQKLYETMDPNTVQQMEMFANKTGEATLGVGAALFMVLLFVYVTHTGNGRGGGSLW